MVGTPIYRRQFSRVFNSRGAHTPRNKSQLVSNIPALFLGVIYIYLYMYYIYVVDSVILTFIKCHTTKGPHMKTIFWSFFHIKPRYEKI